MASSQSADSGLATLDSAVSRTISVNSVTKDLRLVTVTPVPTGTVKTADSIIDSTGVNDLKIPEFSKNKIFQTSPGVTSSISRPAVVFVSGAAAT